MIGSPRIQAETSLVFGPFLLAAVLTWLQTGSFLPKASSFFETFALCVVFVLGGRLWDVQDKANTAEKTIESIRSLIDTNEQKSGELKRVILDSSEHLAGFERRIDATLLEIKERLAAVERKIDAPGGNRG